MTEIIIGYTVCSACAFFLFQRDWRRGSDLTNHDIAFIIFISAFGPLSLIGALGVTALGLNETKPRRVIWRKLP